MTTFRTLTILILIGLTACHSAVKNSAQCSAVDAIVKSQSELENLSLSGDLYDKTPQQIEEERKQYLEDSANMIRTLEFALKIANKQKEKEKFIIETDTLNIRYGHIFSSSVKHLIISRDFPYGIKSDIYKLQDNNFVKVCSKEMAPLAYIGDTIQDVNGDGRLDYLFHWYPMSGCCERDIYDVFLQMSNGNFLSEMEFINPNFSLKEKIIRGRCYGHRAPLYKYKWVGYKVDTIEYIYFPDSTNGNRYIRRKKEDENEKGVIIKQLPTEYKNIGYGSKK